MAGKRPGLKDEPAAPEFEEEKILTGFGQSGYGVRDDLGKPTIADT